MNLNCKLVEKTFNDAEGKPHNYYTLVFKLADNSDLEVTLKSDKAKLLKLSNNVDSNKSFWEDR